jgi:hypothetical protein
MLAAPGRPVLAPPPKRMLPRIYPACRAAPARTGSVRITRSHRASTVCISLARRDLSYGNRLYPPRAGTCPRTSVKSTPHCRSDCTRRGHQRTQLLSGGRSIFAELVCVPSGLIFEVKACILKAGLCLQLCLICIFHKKRRSLITVSNKMETFGI